MADRTFRTVVFAAFAVLASACDRDRPAVSPPSADSATGRWYSESQVERGARVFARHCAACHGARAEGLSEDWRQRLEDGSFPPPPLNGSAHAWHHPLPILLQVINEGGAEFGGRMPGFAEVLSEEEKLAAIAWFQSLWSEDIYAQWQQMGGAD